MISSTGTGAREFVASRYWNEKCDADVKGKCLHKEKAGWRDVWTAAIGGQPSATSILPLASCYEWGSSDPAQIVLSGWYQDGEANSKAPWRQGTVKQVSTQPEVYEFTEPNGGTARLEIKR